MKEERVERERAILNLNQHHNSNLMTLEMILAKKCVNLLRLPVLPLIMMIQS